MKKIVICIFILSLFAVSLGIAQTSQVPFVVLEYYTNENELKILTSQGEELSPFFGMEIAPGDTLVTGASRAELRLEPNGTIIKISRDTEFLVEALQGPEYNANAFSLLGGKIRAVAAKTGGKDNYSFVTPSAVCGVRGTDVCLYAELGETDTAVVLKGKVEFINVNTGESISLTEKTQADVFAPSFTPEPISEEELLTLFSDLEFERLNPANVPGNEAGGDPIKDLREKREAEELAEKQQQEEESKPEQTEPAKEKPEEEEIEEKPEEPSFFDNLLKFLGFEIGTLTVDNGTYAKAVVQPKFEIGDFRLGLYLPVIYQDDLFSPQDWYHPKGNNEWSFGTDQTGTLNILYDIAGDLLLKIKYMEYGEQRDPFFFKLGNISSITVGHGIIMRNYGNDADFPAVRRIGLNLGVTTSFFGFEGVVDDFADLQIFGGRIFFKPVGDSFPMAIGITSILDLYPSMGIPRGEGETLSTLYGNPIFVNGGLDIDFPIVESDTFSLVLFGDIAAMLPYFREDESSFNIRRGFALEALFPGGVVNLSKLRNYGWTAGAFGNIFIVDWRLEYRNYRGTFKPSFFNNTYSRVRGQYVLDTAAYLADPDASKWDKQTMGIYGEAGFTIGDIFTFTGGYFWPWQVGSSGIEASEEDYFLLKLRLHPDVIPVVGIHGSVSYERTRFLPTILQSEGSEDLLLFDAYTVVKGEVVIPLGPSIDLATVIATSAVYNNDGTVRRDPNNPSMIKTAPSVTIETRVSY